MTSDFKYKTHRSNCLKAMLILVAWSCFFITPKAESEECTPANISEQVESEQASAGFFANLRGARKSIRVKAGTILESTRVKQSNINPSHACSASCMADPNPKIVFKAAPNMRLFEYEDHEKCAELAKQTRTAPFTWNNLPLGDYEEFAEHFSDFSRGKGKYGEELYEKCDGSCSPQYEIHITSKPGAPTVADVSVLCGHERDKDDDMFTLTTLLEWQCVKKEPATLR